MPRVSIVLPIYNAEKHLAAAMDSLLAQTFSDFELIAINDGSKDGSLEILRTFQKRDNRVWIITRPNTGLVGALQDGLRAAQTDLIARMDADDIALPQRLEKQVAYMDTHPECVLLGTRVQAIDPHGLPLWEEHNVPTTHEDLDRELMKGRGGVIRHPTAMIRRAAVHKVGSYRNEFNNAEDLDLFLRLAEIGKVANLPDVLLLYRQHYGSINRTKYEIQSQRATKSVYEAAQRRGIKLPDGWAYKPEPPRPANEQLRDWGWAALKQKRADIARKHAWSLMGMQPFKLDSWRLMMCALRGH